MSDAWLGFLGGVLATLVGALIASIVQRNQAGPAVLDKYGRAISPKHLEVVTTISSQNILRHGPGKNLKNNAPGSWV